MAESTNKIEVLITAVDDLSRNMGPIQGALAKLQQQSGKTSEGFAAVTTSSAETGKVLNNVSQVATTLGVNLGPLTRQLSLGAIAFQSLKAAAPITALVAVATGMAAATKAAMDLGAEFYRLSKVTGLSTEALSAFRVAAEDNDSTIQEFAGSLRFFQRNLSQAAHSAGEARYLFMDMGLQTLLKDTQDVEGAIIGFAKRFATIKDASQQNEIAMRFFGRGGREVIQVLQDIGTKGIDPFRQKAEQLGILIRSDEALAANQLKNDLNDIKLGIEGVVTAIGKRLIPGIAEMARAWGEFSRANIELTSRLTILNNNLIQQEEHLAEVTGATANEIRKMSDAELQAFGAKHPGLAVLIMNLMAVRDGIKEINAELSRFNAAMAASKMGGMMGLAETERVKAAEKAKEDADRIKLGLTKALEDARDMATKSAAAMIEARANVAAQAKQMLFEETGDLNALAEAFAIKQKAIVQAAAAALKIQVDALRKQFPEMGEGDIQRIAGPLRGVTGEQTRLQLQAAEIERRKQILDLTKEMEQAELAFGKAGEASLQNILDIEQRRLSVLKDMDAPMAAQIEQLDRASKAQRDAILGRIANYQDEKAIVDASIAAGNLHDVALKKQEITQRSLTAEIAKQYDLLGDIARVRAQSVLDIMRKELDREVQHTKTLADLEADRIDLMYQGTAAQEKRIKNELNELAARKKINAELRNQALNFEPAIRDAQLNTLRLEDEIMDARQRNLEARFDQIREVTINLGQTITNSLGDAFEGVILGTSKLADVGKNLLTAMGRDIIQFFSQSIQKKLGFEDLIFSNLRGFVPNAANALRSGQASVGGFGGGGGGLLDIFSSIFGFSGGGGGRPAGTEGPLLPSGEFFSGGGGVGSLVSGGGNILSGIGSIFGGRPPGVEGPVMAGGQFTSIGSSVMGALGGAAGGFGIGSLINPTTGGGIAGAVGGAAGSLIGSSTAIGGALGIGAGTLTGGITQALSAALGATIGGLLGAMVIPGIGAVIAALISLFAKKVPKPSVWVESIITFYYDALAQAFGEVTKSTILKIKDIKTSKALQTAEEHQKILDTEAQRFTDLLNLFPVTVRDVMSAEMDTVNSILNDFFGRKKYSETGSRNIAKELEDLRTKEAPYGFYSAIRETLGIGLRESLSQAEVVGGQQNFAEYLRQNPDVAADAYFATHPAEHFRTMGQAEGRTVPGGFGAGGDALSNAISRAFPTWAGWKTPGLEIPTGTPEQTDKFIDAMQKLIQLTGSLATATPRGVTQFFTETDITRLQGELEQVFSVPGETFAESVDEMIQNLQPLTDYLNQSIQESVQLFASGLNAAMQSATASDAQKAFTDTLGAGIQDTVVQGLIGAFTATNQFTDVLAPIQQVVRQFQEKAATGAAGVSSATQYLQQNPDVAADAYFRFHPEEHFQQWGQGEGRMWPAAIAPVTNQLPNVSAFAAAIIPAMEQVKARAGELAPVLTELQQLFQSLFPEQAANEQVFEAEHDAIEANITSLERQLELIGLSADEASLLAIQFDIADLAARGLNQTQLNNIKALMMTQRELANQISETTRLKDLSLSISDAIREGIEAGSPREAFKNLAQNFADVLERTIQDALIESFATQTLMPLITGPLSQAMDVIATIGKGRTAEQAVIAAQPFITQLGAQLGALQPIFEAVVELARSATQQVRSTLGVPSGSQNITINISGSVNGDADVTKLARAIGQIISAQVAP